MNPLKSRVRHFIFSISWMKQYVCLEATSIAKDRGWLKEYFNTLLMFIFKNISGAGYRHNNSDVKSDGPPRDITSNEN